MPTEPNMQPGASPQGSDTASLPVATSSDQLVTSSNDIVRTDAEKQQGLKDAAERAAVGDPNSKPPVVEPSKKDEVPSVIDPKKEELPVVDEKNPHGVPAKYLNEDGTPDYKKLADAHVNIEKLLGKKNFSNVNKAEEFEYKPSEGALPIPEENLKAFREKAFAAGMTKEQFTAVMAEYDSIFKNSQADSPFKLADAKDPAQLSKLLKVLEPHWGAVTSEAFESNRTSALKVVETFLPSNFKMTDPVFNHPAVLTLLAKIGAELGEGNITGKDKAGSASEGLRTPDQIRKDPKYKTNSQFYEDGEIMQWYKAQPGGTTRVGSTHGR